MVAQDLPHLFGRHREEVAALVEAHRLLLEESNVDLVDQSRWLQGVITALTAHVSPSPLVKLTLHEGEEPVEGLLVTVGELLSEVRCLHGVGITRAP